MTAANRLHRSVGSLFDACDGSCDNGEAAGTTLPSVEISETHGDVFLTDDDGPSSTSHLQL